MGYRKNSTIYVKTSEKTYPIILSSDFAKTIIDFYEKNLFPRVAVVVTNKTIFELWRTKIEGLCSFLGAKIVFVPDSEKAKSLAVYERLVNSLAGYDEKKSSLAVIAIGGGVVGDLAGFAAGTYRRGIPIIQVPTTLLAQIDSSIGGKTAINLQTGKNLVGVYHQPDCVVLDTGFLSTLREGNIKEGIAEGIKYGVIRSPGLFSMLEEVADMDQIDWPSFVGECAAIKAKVVSCDEKEVKGLRYILNFGHTIGHAIEAATDNHISHGIAVGIGMAKATDIACRLGICRHTTLNRIVRLLDKFSLPYEIKMNTSQKRRFWQALMRDKKFSSGKMRFVLPLRIGAVRVVDGITKDMIRI